MKRKNLIIGIAVVIALIDMGYNLAFAETYHLNQPGGEISKFEALSAAFKDPSRVIYKCSAVAMTNKATFKNIPAGGGTQFIAAPKK